jgi:hypothetical protein
MPPRPRAAASLGYDPSDTEVRRRCGPRMRIRVYDGRPMKDARILETEVLLPKPKGFVRELEEETGYALADGAMLQPMGAFHSLPSETNKYTHVFLATPALSYGPGPRAGTPRSRSTST